VVSDREALADPAEIVQPTIGATSHGHRAWCGNCCQMGARRDDQQFRLPVVLATTVGNRHCGFAWGGVGDQGQTVAIEDRLTAIRP
jgi:hypothetical protein